MVALDDGDLREVAFVVGHDLALPDARGDHEVLGEDLIPDEADGTHVLAPVR